MTEEEYLTAKKQMEKANEKLFFKAWHNEISVDEYMMAHKKWVELLENAKKESWYVHI